tara:strand:- start:478 stop:675 length:198 start_codon:yes stop_codon:yes gene_type:complete
VKQQLTKELSKQARGLRKITQPHSGLIAQKDKQARQHNHYKLQFEHSQMLPVYSFPVHYNRPAPS